MSPQPASPLCDTCSAGPGGLAGHADLEFYVAGPFPGQSIFKCASCGDRWIRHYGGHPNAHAWTRFAEQFPTAIRLPITEGKRAVGFPF